MENYKVKVRYFGKILFTVVIGVLGILGLLVACVQPITKWLSSFGSLFSNINDYQYENHLKEDMLYVQSLGMSFTSLLFSIPLVWVFNLEDKKIQRPVVILSFSLMLIFDLILYITPTSPLRELKITSELVDWTILNINVKYIYRFLQNFGAVYIFYGFPILLQMGMSLLLYRMLDIVPSKGAYIFFSISYFLIAILGSIILLMYVIVLSFIGALAVLIGILIGIITSFIKGKD